MGNYDFDAMIKKEINSPTAQKMHDALKAVWDNKEFICGNLQSLKTDEQKQKLLDILDEWELDSSEINLAVLDIADGIEPEIEEDE